ncbi:hypothetical protein [Pseudomonas syringae]|uniref:hypothetical protein n=1 Tax=Pseudomonas syringae TaxID=317 RepID=UPI001372E9F9|nr:hypothetical protein [Pseudomonas syringae]
MPPLRLPNQRLPDYPQSLQPGEAETLYNDGAMAKTVDGASGYSDVNNDPKILKLYLQSLWLEYPAQCRCKNTRHAT